MLLKEIGLNSTLAPCGEPLAEWLQTLASEPELAALLAPVPAERVSRGYGHTLTEICQQPLLWADTALRVAGAQEQLAECVRGSQWLALTGSGSSQYVGECVHPVLQTETGLPAFTAGAGSLLLDGMRGVPASRPGLLISFARSGDSPESAALVELFTGADSRVRHLIITCNRDGRLATQFGGHASVRVLALDPRTNDRSLVMTSSFTNMVLAARALGLLEQPGALDSLVRRLSRLGRDLLLQHTGAIAGVARGPFEKAVFLASGSRFGAARESALKMLEMTSGRIPTMAETYLGLRHGPMCLVDSATLVVCYLSSDPLARSYELDLIGELNRKELGATKLVAGEGIPASLLAPGDVALEMNGIAAIGDASAAVLDTMIGQLLAFFRCMAGGLRPDQPSTGVISRVVNEFSIHRAPGFGR